MPSRLRNSRDRKHLPEHNNLYLNLNLPPQILLRLSVENNTMATMMEHPLLSQTLQKVSLRLRHRDGQLFNCPHLIPEKQPGPPILPSTSRYSSAQMRPCVSLASTTSRC